MHFFFLTLKGQFKVKVIKLAHSSELVKGYLVLKFGWSIISRFEDPLLSLIDPRLSTSCLADICENIWTEFGRVPIKSKYLANIFIFLGPLSQNGPFCLQTLGH